MADFNLSNARILSPGVVATPLDAVPKERSFFGSVAEGLKTADDLQTFWKTQKDLETRNKLLSDYSNLEDDGSIAELDRQIAKIEARLQELDKIQQEIVANTPAMLVNPVDGTEIAYQNPKTPVTGQYDWRNDVYGALLDIIKPKAAVNKSTEGQPELPIGPFGFARTK